jgi:hypothetical protein
VKQLCAIALALMLAAFAPQPPISDKPPRLNAGERQRITVSITDYIRLHLINNRCWTDHSDLPDARTLRATFRIWLGRDGKFSRPPELIQPATDPEPGSPSAQFVDLAREALRMCDAIGWPVVEAYFEVSDPPPYIDILFMPKVVPANLN